MTRARASSFRLLIIAMLLSACPWSLVEAVEVRIKDITTIQGDRENVLTGIGLVTGLNGTGGNSQRKNMLVNNFLNKSGLRSDPRLLNPRGLDSKNTALVAVTAKLPVNASQHDTIDVTISAIDDSKSLANGQLLLTPLFGPDNVVYATAAGSIIVGGFSVGGQSASVAKNHPTVGMISKGATIEEEVCFDLAQNNRFTLMLNDPDFATADRIVRAINGEYPGAAKAVGKSKVEILIPPAERLAPEEFIGEVGLLKINPDTSARIVINERTGTVVFGENVKISQANVNHANLLVSTSETDVVSQPAPLSNGETTVVPRSDVQVIEQRGPIKSLPETTSVKELVSALNLIGASPQDLVQIFKALDSAGALHAKLVIQ